MREKKIYNINNDDENYYLNYWRIRRKGDKEDPRK